METDVLRVFGEIAGKVTPAQALAPLNRESKVLALGIDSVSLMEIIGVIEDELDVSIPDEKLAGIQTLGNLENVIKEPTTVHA